MLFFFVFHFSLSLIRELSQLVSELFSSCFVLEGVLIGVDDVLFWGRHIHQCQSHRKLQANKYSTVFRNSCAVHLSKCAVSINVSEALIWHLCYVCAVAISKIWLPKDHNLVLQTEWLSLFQEPHKCFVCKAALGPVITWRCDLREYAGCCW
jgi:hypothetical protein